MSLAQEIVSLFIAENQAGKYLTHNRGILLLAVMSGGVKSRVTVDPPGAPETGDAYIIPADATGAWFNREDQIAVYYDGWLFFDPIPGPIVAVEDGDGGDYVAYVLGSPNEWTALTIGDSTDEFTDLIDVPSSYTGQAGKGVRVNSGATGLEFYDTRPVVAIPIACSDETTALTTGTAKVTFRMPFAFTLTGIRASVTTAPTSADLIVDVNAGGATIMTTDKLRIDAGEKTSTTAATPPALTTTSLADDIEMTIDIDQIGSTIASAGLKVYLIGYKT